LARRQHTELETVSGDPAVTLGEMRRKPQHVLLTEPSRTNYLLNFLIVLR
jgi:hypothetical protein